MNEFIMSLVLVAICVGFGVIGGYHYFKADLERKKEKKAEEEARLKIEEKYKLALNNFSFVAHHLMQIKKDKWNGAITEEVVDKMTKDVEWMQEIYRNL